MSALNEAACNLPGFSTGLACEPWLAAGPPLVPAAPGGSRWSRWKAALASKAAAVKAAVVEPAPSPAPQPPQYWLSVAIPSVPRPGGAAYLEATLTSLLRQLPLDPSGEPPLRPLRAAAARLHQGLLLALSTKGPARAEPPTAGPPKHPTFPLPCVPLFCVPCRRTARAGAGDRDEPPAGAARRF